MERQKPPRLFIHFSLPEEKQSPPKYQGIVDRNTLPVPTF
jgi:hypothetical protein